MVRPCERYAEATRQQEQEGNTNAVCKRGSSVVERRKPRPLPSRALGTVSSSTQRFSLRIPRRDEEYTPGLERHDIISRIEDRGIVLPDHVFYFYFLSLIFFIFLRFFFIRFRLLFFSYFQLGVYGYRRAVR